MHLSILSTTLPIHNVRLSYYLSSHTHVVARVSVVSWNILSDAHVDGIGRPDLRLLPHTQRNVLLLEAIIAEGSDVVCLQEVESHIYHRLLQPFLERAGYDSVYHRRAVYTAAQPGSSSEEWLEERLDGCATFWRRDRYEIAERGEMQ